MPNRPTHQDEGGQGEEEYLRSSSDRPKSFGNDTVNRPDPIDLNDPPDYEGVTPEDIAAQKEADGHWHETPDQTRLRGKEIGRVSKAVRRLFGK